ncbi:MAG: restriction endonuclease subunit S [Deltaproteobacteria bacterium]|nr:restriction endonuclease subunit S [Deltaproteobacteria bacterium]
MRLKAYSAYKDSCIEWLGEIPEHWETKRVKTMLSRNDSGVWGNDFDDEGVVVLRSTEQTVGGDWSIIEPAKRRLSIHEYVSAMLIEGDLVVTKSSGSSLHIGKTSIVTKEVAALNCCYSNFMQRLRVQPTVDPFFMRYVLNGEIGRKQFDYLSSTTTGLANLNSEVIGNVIATFPSQTEQRTIAAFLNRETERIDALIAKKEWQIELLQEKRIALISHVVTKGLNPDVKMKDSGIEWLGEIPEHWRVLSIKRLTLVKRGASPRPIDDPKYFEEDGEYAWVRIADVTASSRYLEKTTQQLSELGKSLSVPLEPGALFLSIAGTVGKPIINKIRCCIHDGFVYFPQYRENKNFLYYILVSGQPYHGLGKWGTQLNLNTDTVGGIHIGLPTRDEQDAIAAFLDRETERLDNLIKKVQESLDMLREYRTALISAAVTGKIDVRKEVA